MEEINSAEKLEDIEVHDVMENLKDITDTAEYDKVSDQWK